MMRNILGLRKAPQSQIFLVGFYNQYHIFPSLTVLLLHSIMATE